MKKILRFVGGGSDSKRRSSMDNKPTSSTAVTTTTALSSSSSPMSSDSSRRLHKAVLREDLEGVKFLASKLTVSDLDATDAQGRSALHLACEKGSCGLVWPLVSYGATLGLRDARGRTPLHVALSLGHQEAAQLLLDKLNKGDLDVQDGEGDCGLHLTTRLNDGKMTALLLRKGADPDLVNGVNESPLHEALRLSQLNLAQMLLRCGADANLRGPMGLTPLMIACGNPDTRELVESLLDYEADPTITDARGWSAAKYAEQAGQRGLVPLLKQYEEALRDEVMHDDDDLDDDFDNEDMKDIDNGLRNTKLVVERVESSDGSSWGSDSPPITSENPVRELKTSSGVKHSRGLMDLSNLTNDDDEDLKQDSEHSFGIQGRMLSLQVRSPKQVDSFLSVSLPTNKIHVNHVDEAQEPNDEDDHDHVDERSECDEAVSLKKAFHTELQSKVTSRSSLLVDNIDSSPPLASSSRKWDGDELGAEQEDEDPLQTPSPLSTEPKEMLETKKSEQSTGMISEELMAMEKVELLIHVQKIQLELEQARHSAQIELKTQRELESTRSQLEETLSKSKRMQEVAAVLRSEHQRMEGLLEEKNEIIKQLREQMNDSNETELLHQLKKSQGVEKMDKEIRELKQEAETRRRNHETSVLELRRGQTQLEDQLVECRQKLASAIASNSRLESEKLALENTLVDLEQSVSSKENLLSSTLQETESRLKETVRRSEMLEQQLKERDEKCLEMEKDFEMAKRELRTQTEETRKRAEETRSRMAEEIQGLKSDLSVAAVDRDRLRRSLEERQLRLHEVDNHMKTTTTIVDNDKDKVDENDQLRGLLSDQRAKVREKENRVRELEAEVVANKEKLVSSEASVDHLRHQVEELHSQIDQQMNRARMAERSASASESDIGRVREEHRLQVLQMEREKERLECRLQRLEKESKEELRRMEVASEASMEASQKEAILSSKSAEEQRERMKRMREEMRVEITHLETEKRELNSRLRATVENKKELEESVVILKKEMERRSNLWMEEQQSFKMELSNLEAQMSDMEHRVEQEHLVVEEERSKNNELRLSLEDMDNKLRQQQTNERVREQKQVEVQQGKDAQHQLQLDTLRKELRVRENDLAEMRLQCEGLQKRLHTSDKQIKHLENSVLTLESSNQDLVVDKKSLVAKIHEREIEINDINVDLVAKLRQQLNEQKSKLDQERESHERSQYRGRELERQVECLRSELESATSEQTRSESELLTAKQTVCEVYEKLYNLETQKEQEKSRQQKQDEHIDVLENQLQMEQRRCKLAEMRLTKVTEKLREEEKQREEERRKKLECNKNNNNDDDDDDNELMNSSAVVLSLEAEIEKLRRENDGLSDKLRMSMGRMQTLQCSNKKLKLLHIELKRKDKLILELETKLEKVREAEWNNYQRDLSKFRLQCEILARNEVNSKLADINGFLEERARENTHNEMSREKGLAKIQRDLGDKLTHARDELASIKVQMKDTEYGVRHLQSQLLLRDQELNVERNLRRQLERQLERERQLYGLPTSDHQSKHGHRSPPVCF